MRRSTSEVTSCISPAFTGESAIPSRGGFAQKQERVRALKSKGFATAEIVELVFGLRLSDKPEADEFRVFCPRLQFEQKYSALAKFVESA